MWKDLLIIWLKMLKLANVFVQIISLKVSDIRLSFPAVIVSMRHISDGWCRRHHCLCCIVECSVIVEI